MKDDNSGDLGPSVEDYLAYLLTGIPPVSLEPSVDVEGWEIMEVEGSWGKSHHVVGIFGEGNFDRFGRVSSPIQHFDPATRQVTTRSGRVYLLRPETLRDDGERREHERIREAWLRRNGLAASAFTDVTGAYRSKLA